MTPPVNDSGNLTERYRVMVLPALVVYKYDMWRNEAESGFVVPFPPLTRTGEEGQLLKEELPDQARRVFQKLPSQEITGVDRLEYEGKPIHYHERRQLPAQLQHIAEGLNASRRLVLLPDNWDGEGSKGCEGAVWERATRTLITQALGALSTLDLVVRMPIMMPDCEGGIDILWESPDYALVLNVPDDPAESITFFGNSVSDPDSTKTTGELLPENSPHPGVLSWLACLLK